MNKLFLSRTISSVILCCLLFSTVCFASDKATYQFTATSSQRSYLSASATKNDYTDADVYPEKGATSSGIYFVIKRGTSALDTGNVVTGGHVTYNNNHFILSYKSGYAIPSHYNRLYVYSYYNGTKDIKGAWYP